MHWFDLRNKPFCPGGGSVTEQFPGLTQHGSEGIADKRVLYLPSHAAAAVCGPLPAVCRGTPNGLDRGKKQQQDEEESVPLQGFGKDLEWCSERI